MALLATALACLSMHAGCGGPPVATLPMSRFSLVYERTGGLKPTSRKLEIRGHVGTVEELRSGNGEGHGGATIFKVPSKTIEGLRRALARADFASLPSPGAGPGTCADCYSYEIEYRRHDVTFDDATIPEVLRPVLHRLESIVEAHLPFH